MICHGYGYQSDRTSCFQALLRATNDQLVSNFHYSTLNWMCCFRAWKKNRFNHPSIKFNGKTFGVNEFVKNIIYYSNRKEKIPNSFRFVLCVCTKCNKVLEKPTEKFENHRDTWFELAFHHVFNVQVIRQQQIIWIMFKHDL